MWIEVGEGVGLMAEMKVLEGELQQDAAGRFAQYLEAEAEGCCRCEKAEKAAYLEGQAHGS